VLRTIVTSRIHRATVTGAEPDGGGLLRNPRLVEVVPL
jgi:aspartate 1-decarboxylase